MRHALTLLDKTQVTIRTSKLIAIDVADFMTLGLYTIVQQLEPFAMGVEGGATLFQCVVVKMLQTLIRRTITMRGVTKGHSTLTIVSIDDGGLFFVMGGG